ncbi:MAG: NosD domain-containing protein [Candidatus Hodarchaeales archaeon]
MSLLFIDDNFKTYLREPAGGKNYQLFVDFRQKVYPPLAGHGLSFHKLDQLIERGHCDSPNAPMVKGESTPVTSNCTWSRSSTEAYRGNYSWRMVKTSASGDGHAQAYFQDTHSDTDMHGLIPGKTYTLKCMMRTDTANVDHTFLIVAQYYDGAWHYKTLCKLSISNQWEEVGGTFTVDLNCTGILLYIQLWTDVPAGDSIWIDQISLTEENQPGSFVAQFGNLAGDPAPKYCFEMPDYFTFWVRVKPYFAYDTDMNPRIFTWRIDNTHRLILYYRSAEDKIRLYWIDGGTGRSLWSQQFDDGTNYDNLNQWLDIVGIIDLRTSQSTGSSLYVNWVLQDSNWGGNVDIKSSNFPLLSIGHVTEAYHWDGEIAFLRIWPNYLATSTDISNRMRNIKTEEVYWSFNGHGTGRTRCNISHRVNSLGIEMTKESRAGFLIANKGWATINNVKGIFSDDQYASFDPENEQYNGTSDEKYLQKRCPVEMEVYYGDSFEPIFFGRLTADGFKRESAPGDKSTVRIEFEDMTEEMSKVYVEETKYYEGLQFADESNESNSLITQIGKLATALKIYNYASNSSFENATIGNSWLTSGNVSISRSSSEALFGTYSCEGVWTGSGYIYQEIRFTGDKKLNVGDKWVFAIWMKSSLNVSVDIKIEERDSAGLNNSSSESCNYTGGSGWKRYEVEHEITDSASDRLRIVLEENASVTIYFDGAMLTEGEGYEWFILNADDGNGTYYSADSPKNNDRYDVIERAGYDIVSVTDTHPWALVLPDYPVWTYMGDIATATLARSMGFDWCGALRYRSRFNEQESDPNAIEDITGDDIHNFTADILKASYNKIIVRGAYYNTNTADPSVKYKTKWCLWSATKSGVFDGGEQMRVAIANGEYFPDPTTFGSKFFARYDQPWASISRQSRSHGSYPGTKRYYTQTINYKLSDRYGGAKLEIVGIKNAQLNVRASGTLTQTLFDTTTRPDGAYFKLYNGTGSTVYVYGVSIVGNPVIKITGGEGYVHDWFKDIKDIRENGENDLEIANDYICSTSQVDKIAEYWWKSRKGGKHKYSMSMTGGWLWLLPGEWVNVVVGQAGLSEYINSKAEIAEVNWEYNASTGEEKTSIILYEQLENWKKDSTYSTRFEAYAPGMRNQQMVGATLIIGASDYTDVAHYYCSGSSDEDIINDAIDYLYEKYGGGRIRLSNGTFNIDGKIVLKPGIRIEGESKEGTIINRNCNDNAIYGNYTDNVGIYNLTIKCEDSNQIGIINIRDSNDVYIYDVIFENINYWALWNYMCNNFNVRNCIFNDIPDLGTTGSYGIGMNADGDFIVENCIFKGNTDGEDMSRGISISLSGDNLRGVIKDCFIDDCRYGIELSGASSNKVKVSINKNKIDGCTYYGIFIYQCDYIDITDNKVTSCSPYGIQLSYSDGTNIKGNTCISCGYGIRLSNSNRNNLVENVSFNNSYGISVGDANCNDNVIVGNILHGNTTAFSDYGTNTQYSSNYGV